MKRVLSSLFFLLVLKSGIGQVTINPLQYTIKFETQYRNQYSTNTQTDVFLQNEQYVTALYKSYSDDYNQDSILIVQGQNPPKKIHFLHSWVYLYQEYDGYNYYLNEEWLADAEDSVQLRYPFFDTTIVTGPNTFVKVKVQPNFDISNNLPSLERITLASSAYVNNRTWQYQLGSSTDWNTIPSSLYGDNSLSISGYDLFGSSYISHLNETIKIRMSYYSGYQENYSNIAVFTHLLSAPHIVSIAPSNIGCYGAFTGAMDVTFDRALLDGERINLLLADTLKYADFSALNITALTSSNQYTWQPELAAGTYFLSMLGKYDGVLPLDITVNSRNTNVKRYAAKNSITFEPGFESVTDDEFQAATGMGSGYPSATYTGSPTHYSFMTIEQPSRIQYYLQKQNDVSCKGSSNGAIWVFAKGGVGNFKFGLQRQGEIAVSWTNFSNNNIDPVSGHVKQQITGLTAGTYYISIRDGNNCILKDSTGKEITRSMIITEPQEALRLDLLESSPITSTDSTNGKIRIKVAGGTPYINQEVPGNKYYFELKDSATGVLVSNYTLDNSGNNFDIGYANLSEATYVLYVQDNKYSSSPGGTNGCNVKVYIPIKKPQPLQAAITLNAPITCNGLGNAKLLASASGGYPIDSLRYQFRWFKYNGSSYTITTGTDSVLSNVVPGQYYVEIEDKYGNKKQSAAYTVTEPSVIQLSLASIAASCYSTPDGGVSVTVSGGTPGYKYEWSTGQQIQSINNLPGGNYVVVVKDNFGCEAVGQVAITSPVQVTTTAAITPVTCQSSNTGSIQLTASGGTGNYTYQWSNSVTSSAASNLGAGRYWYKVSDANGCYATDTVELDTPDLLKVNLGPDHGICAGQTVQLIPDINTAGGLTYNWTGNNGFTANTGNVSVTQPGTYIIAASNSRNCIVKDTIMLTAVNSTISTDYIVSSQAFKNENVVLINISNPVPDSVQWRLPVTNSIRVLQINRNYCELQFADTGKYEISMKAFYSSGCIDMVKKQVIIVNKETFGGLGNQAQAILKSFTVSPNPNNGQFTVNLLFNSPTKARLRLINTLSNVLVNDRTIEGNSSYILNYNYSGSMVSGTYVLIIETSQASFVYKIVVM